MSDLSIPLQGMSRAETRVNRTAERVARVGGTLETPEDSVDLSADMVNLMQGRNDYAMNAKVAKTFEQMSGAVLNILA